MYRFLSSLKSPRQWYNKHTILSAGLSDIVRAIRSIDRAAILSSNPKHDLVAVA